MKQPTKLRLYRIYPHKLKYPYLVISWKIFQQISSKVFPELSKKYPQKYFQKLLREVKGRQDAQQKHQSPPEFEQPLSIETANQITVV